MPYSTLDQTGVSPATFESQLCQACPYIVDNLWPLMKAHVYLKTPQHRLVRSFSGAQTTVRGFKSIRFKLISARVPEVWWSFWPKMIQNQFLCDGWVSPNTTCSFNRKSISNSICTSLCGTLRLSTGPQAWLQIRRFSLHPEIRLKQSGDKLLPAGVIVIRVVPSAIRFILIELELRLSRPYSKISTGHES